MCPHAELNIAKTRLIPKASREPKATKDPLKIKVLIIPKDKPLSTTSRMPKEKLMVRTPAPRKRSMPRMSEVPNYLNFIIVAYHHSFHS
jgi:hypothetical protein